LLYTTNVEEEARRRSKTREEEEVAPSGWLSKEDKDSMSSLT
jgi:hypothetical protein